MKNYLISMALACCAQAIQAQSSPTSAPKDTINPILTKPMSALQTSSVIGASLAGRRLLFRARPTNLPEDLEGVILLQVCVDSAGTVVEATNLPEKSTLADPKAVEALLLTARRYRFAPALEPKVCGTLTFRFSRQ